MRYLFDTNYLSELRRPRPNASVLAWSMANNSMLHAVSVATVCEIRTGIEEERVRAPRRASNLEAWLDGIIAEFEMNILPVTVQIAEMWGKLSAKLKREDLDILIAATALEQDLTLVTRNVSDFKGTGVRIVNPWN